MTDIEVVFDPVKELACIVDVDLHCAWGPAMIGPNAGTILQTWIDTMPFDVTVLDSGSAYAAFQSFLRESGTAPDGTSGTDEQVAQADGVPYAPTADASLAEREAANATDTPAPAPADTDVEADTSAPDQVIRCVNCNGAGTIQFGGDAGSQQCNMCKGTGRLTVSAV